MLSIEKLESRRKGIGGSDVAAIFGLNTWKSPVDVYLEKVGESKPQPQNEAMYFGSKQESLIADEFQERTGKKCIIKEDAIIHPTNDWMIGLIDREIKGESAILECKTSSRTEGWGDEWTDEIPDSYLLQCAHYAIILDVEVVYIAALLLGNKFKIYQYKRNEKLEDVIIEKEFRFWHENVLAKKIPDPINLNDIKSLYSTVNPGKRLFANEKIRDLMDKLEIININKKSVEKEEEKLKIKLFSEIGDAEIIEDEFGNEIASYKNRNRTNLNTNQLKKEHPGIYEKYSYSSSYRVYLPKNIDRD